MRGAQDGLSPRLFDRIARQPPDKVLDEPAEVEAQRKAELEVVHKLRAAKGVLEQLTVSSAPGFG